MWVFVLDVTPVHTRIATLRLCPVLALIELVALGDHQIPLVDGIPDVVLLKL